MSSRSDARITDRALPVPWTPVVLTAMKMYISNFCDMLENERGSN
jgi:hypothetical protein